MRNTKYQPHQPIHEFSQRFLERFVFLLGRNVQLLRERPAFLRAVVFGLEVSENAFLQMLRH